MKKSREHRRLLYRGDEFLKKTLKNSTIVEPNYGHNEPVVRIQHFLVGNTSVSLAGFILYFFHCIIGEIPVAYDTIP